MIVMRFMGQITALFEKPVIMISQIKTREDNQEYSVGFGQTCKKQSPFRNSLQMLFKLESLCQIFSNI